MAIACWPKPEAANCSWRAAGQHQLGVTLTPRAARCRPLAALCINSAKGADADITQALMLKLYKEPSDSAFYLWAASGVCVPRSCLSGTCGLPQVCIPVVLEACVACPAAEKERRQSSLQHLLFC